MIESRGNDNKVVTSAHGVLVEDIAKAVIEYKTLDWICNRYPVSVDEVFEVIDYLADTLEDSINFKSIKFKNLGTPDDIDLETRMITDGVYFKVLQYGKILYPEVEVFEDLYAKGLSSFIADIYTDLDNGNTDFEYSPIHNAIYHGVTAELGDLTPAEVLANFDFEEYINRKNAK